MQWHDSTHSGKLTTVVWCDAPLVGDDDAGRLLVDYSNDNSNDDHDNDNDDEERLHSWCSNNCNHEKEDNKRKQTGLILFPAEKEHPKPPSELSGCAF